MGSRTTSAGTLGSNKSLMPPVPELRRIKASYIAGISTSLARFAKAPINLVEVLIFPSELLPLLFLPIPTFSCAR